MEPVRLAGRCECGVLREWAKGDEHLPCSGRQRCVGCKQVKLLTAFQHQKGETNPRKRCRLCVRYRHTNYMRGWYAGNREAHRKSSRESEARARRGDSPRYVKQKAKKREAYRANRGVRVGREAA